VAPVGDKLQQAIEDLHRSIALDPSTAAEAYNDLGNALADHAQWARAIDAYQQALAIKPDSPDVLNNLGMVHLQLGQVDQAIACHRRAVSLAPDIWRSHCYFADALAAKDQFEEALGSYDRALSLAPDNHEIHNNLGNALLQLGRLDEAVAAYRRSLQLRRDILSTHTNLAHALLTQGKLAEGWRELETRWRIGRDPATGKLPADIWDGTQDLKNRTVLLHTEQGFGDTIQFIRYLPMLAERGARVIVECLPPLKRLLEIMPGVEQVVIRGDPSHPADFHAMLLSLPANFGITIDMVPARVPYLRAPESLRQQWSHRVAAGGKSHQLNVGLAWAGNPRQKNDRNRSMPLAMLAPLLDLAHVRFYSLQTGDAADQMRELPPTVRERITDHTSEICDFADTAALIQQLDLVISVDTSVAHLAGALGKPTWTLLTHTADWRWLTERGDSPWYPTMRLFRQTTRGDWPDVIRRVRAALAALRV
jgi:tetratricopeptide (TPR) repeat protein